MIRPQGMRKMKMKFGTFEFPVNPKNLKVSSSANCREKAIFGKNAVVENVSVNPTIISGKGELADKNGEATCSYLMHILKTKKSYWLFAPDMVPIKAYLTDFTYEQSSLRNSYLYTFKFVEDCKDKSEMIKIPYTIARNGENAFDIAYRCGVSVDDIMMKNDIATPFDIREEDKVMLEWL